MKKILLVAVAALAITSCSQNEEFENPNQKAEINFSTIVSKATRASELTTDSLKKSDGFQVYAYNTGQDVMKADLSLAGKEFMNGVLLKWNETDKNWGMNPAGPYYWPLDEKIQFFAYSPVSGVTYTAPTGSGYPSFNYTIGDVASQKDLVVAYANDQTKPNTPNTPVELTFKHILTQINFKLKGSDADYTYTVTEISLSDIQNKGTFTYDEPSKIGAWSSTSGTGTYVYAATYSDFTNTADLTIATGDNGLMLMPQALLETAKIKITYSTKKDNKKYFDGTKEVSLKDIVWNAGDKILYTLSLPSGAEEVTFKSTVGSWNTEKPEDKEAA